jgi:C-terminal processing protease CtpA/Prc
MQKGFSRILVLVGIILFISCKKDNPAPSTDYTIKDPIYSDTLERQYSSFNQAIYNLMKTIYLWNDKVPQIDYNASRYSENPDLLLEDLKYTTLDKFSFVSDKTTTDQLFEEGKETGLGVGFDLLNEITLKISIVYPGSPAEAAGLYRGMTVKKLNDVEVIGAINDGSIYNVLNTSTIKFEVLDTTGKSKTISVTAAQFTLKTVVKKSIINQNGKKIGYLMFNSFLGTSENELKEAFSFFNSNNIDELVLDLRYNGGGYVDVAQQLAALIGGTRVNGKTFIKYLFNERLKSENVTTTFTAENDALNLSRVFIISSKQTASASEIVINSLKPYLDVKVIGFPSYGKPVGFIGWGYKDKYVFPVMFKSANANDESDYFNGIVPDQYSLDGLNYDLGDVRENRLADALYYIKNGSFQSSARIGSETERPIIPFGLKSAIGTF